MLKRDYDSDTFTAKEREAEYTREAMNLQLSTVSNRANSAKAMLQKFPVYTVPRNYTVTTEDGSTRYFTRAHNTFDTRWDETVGSYIAYSQRMYFWLAMSGAIAASGYQRYIIEHYFYFRMMALYAELTLIPKFVFAVDTDDTNAKLETSIVKQPQHSEYAEAYKGNVTDEPTEVSLPKNYYKRIYSTVRTGDRYDPSEYYYKFADDSFYRAVPNVGTDVTADGYFKNLNGLDRFYKVKFREYKIAVPTPADGMFAIGNRYYVYDRYNNDYIPLTMTLVWNETLQKHDKCTIADISADISAGKQIYRDVKVSDPLQRSATYFPQSELLPGDVCGPEIVVDASADIKETDVLAKEVVALIVSRYNYILELYVPLLKLLRRTVPTVKRITQAEYTVRDISGRLREFMQWINEDRVRRGGSPMVFDYDPYSYTIYELKRGINAIITSFTEDASGLAFYLRQIATSWSKLIEYTTYFRKSATPDVKSLPRIVKSFLIGQAELIKKFVFAVPSTDTVVSVDTAVLTKTHKVYGTDDQTMIVTEEGIDHPLKDYCTRRYTSVADGTLYSEGDTYYIRKADGSFISVKIPLTALDSDGRFSDTNGRYYVVSFIEYKLPVARYTDTSTRLPLDYDREYFSFNEETGEYTELATEVIYVPATGYAKAGMTYYVEHVDTTTWYEPVHPVTGLSADGLFEAKRQLTNQSFRGTLYGSLKLGDPLPEGIETDSPEEMEREINANEVLPLLVSRFNEMMRRYSPLFNSLSVSSDKYIVPPDSYTVRSKLMENIADFIEFRNDWRASLGLVTMTVPIDRNAYTVYNLKKAYNAIVDMYKQDIDYFPDDDPALDDFVVDRYIKWTESIGDKVYSYNELGYHFEPNDQNDPNSDANVYDLMELWAHLDYKGSQYVIESLLDLLNRYDKWKNLLPRAAEIGLNDEDVRNVKVMQAIYNRCVYTNRILQHCGYPVLDIAHHLDNVIPIKINEGIQK